MFTVPLQDLFERMLGWVCASVRVWVDKVGCAGLAACQTKTPGGIRMASDRVERPAGDAGGNGLRLGARACDQGHGLADFGRELEPAGLTIVEAGSVGDHGADSARAKGELCRPEACGMIRRADEDRLFEQTRGCVPDRPGMRMTPTTDPERERTLRSLAVRANRQIDQETVRRSPNIQTDIRTGMRTGMRTNIRARARVEGASPRLVEGLIKIPTEGPTEG